MKFEKFGVKMNILRLRILKETNLSQLNMRVIGLKKYQYLNHRIYSPGGNGAAMI